MRSINTMRGIHRQRRGAMVAMRIVLAALFGTGPSLASAQTATYVDTVKAEFVAQGPTGWYGSVEEAFVAYQVWLSTVQCTGPNLQCSADSLQVCPTNAHFQNGEPVSWCWHQRNISNGQLVFDGITGGINKISVCPTDYTSVGSTTGSGTVADPWRSQRSCERTKTVVLNRECGSGNPIYPDSGTKRQREHGYSSATGALRFTWMYHSDYGRFRHEYDLEFMPPGRSTGNSCKGGQTLIYDGNGSVLLNLNRCFQTLNPDPTGTVGYFTGEDGALNKLIWNGSVGASAAPYFKDRLTSTTVDGSPGWLLARADENRLLVFDAAGKLQSVQYINGSRVSVTRVGGYISTISDERGRMLQVTDGPNGVAGFTDPAGGTVAYEYQDINKLSRVTYQDGAAKAFVWDEAAWSTGFSSPNRLTGIVDEANKRYASFAYRFGKAVSTEHAGGVDRYALTDNRYVGACWRRPKIDPPVRVVPIQI
jgi:hypothetical protein